MRRIPLVFLLMLACEAEKSDVAEAETDRDGDGFGEGADCDDGDPRISPAAEEACDGVDNNCNGEVDEGLTQTWIPDADGDGFGDPNASAITACDRPEGAVPNSDDCDDGDPETFPGGLERCDGLDTDCDGLPDPVTCRPLETADLRLRGEQEGGGLGRALAGGHDLDGDGLADLLVGAPREGGAGEGTLYAIHGPEGGELSTSAATGRLRGSRREASLGWSVAAIADVDGDALGEVWVGAPGDGPRGAGSGAAYLFSGPFLGEIGEEDALLVISGEEGDQAGLSVAAVGDLDGDGLGDLCVGAPGTDGAAADVGAVWLFSAALRGNQGPEVAFAGITGSVERDELGRSVVGPGDLNGDGLADVVVGAYGLDPVTGPDAGAVLVYYGPVAGILGPDSADVAWLGPLSGIHAGAAVAAAGDQDGDGTGDLVIGLADDPTGGVGAGSARIVSANVAGVFSVDESVARLLGRAPGDKAGQSVALAGDVDGDGNPDLLVGAYLDDRGEDNAGTGYLAFGPHRVSRSLGDEDGALVGEAEGDLAGWAVAGAGDVEGDGKADVWVGAPGSAAGAGSAYLLFGAGLSR